MSLKKPSEKSKIPTCIVLLHDIRSVINVGAIFRTADAIGVSEIVLSGTTPTPVDRFGRIRSDFAKSALGAEKKVPWRHITSLSTTLRTLKKNGYDIYALEQSLDSVDYKSVRPSEKIVLIPGNEVTGVPVSLLKKSDLIIEIPMQGIKESLNISVAVGIVLYQLLDR